LEKVQNSRHVDLDARSIVAARHHQIVPLHSRGASFCSVSPTIGRRKSCSPATIARQSLDCISLVTCYLHGERRYRDMQPLQDRIREQGLEENVAELDRWGYTVFHDERTDRIVDEVREAIIRTVAAGDEEK